MEKILDPLIEGVNSGNYLVIAFIVVLTILFNLEKISNFLDSRNKVKIKFIEEAIKNPNVDGKTKLHLESLIEIEYFKSITGIYLEKEIREKLIQAHLKTNGELKFKHFKRAVPFLTYTDSTLSIELGFWRKLEFIYNLIFGIIMVLMGLVSGMLPVLSPETTPTNILLALCIAVALVSFGFLMLMQCVPMLSARHVREVLNNNNQEPDKSQQELKS